MNVFGKALHNTKHWANKNSGTIFTILEVVGVLGVAVLTAHCATKANKKMIEKSLDKLDELAEMEERPEGEVIDEFTTQEIVETVAPCYIPAVIACAAEIALIICAGKNANKKITGLAAGLALADQKYREYREQVKETLGKEVDTEVCNEVVKKKVEKVDLKQDPSKELFYDEFSGRFFESTEKDILWAMHEANALFSNCGIVSMNEVYNCGFPLECIEEGDYYGLDCGIADEFDGRMFFDFYITNPVTAKSGKQFRRFVIDNVQPLDYDEANRRFEAELMAAEKARYKNALEEMAQKS